MVVSSHGRLGRVSEGPTRLYESGYDPESDLRLVRFTGHFDLEWLVAAAPHDRTLKHLPHCLTIVDQRFARFAGAPSQVSDLAARMARLVNPQFRDRYAWLVDRMETVGFALHFQAEMGAGRVFWFSEVEDACSWLGVTPADFERAESLLQAVESDI